ncbi:MAG: UDP-N-acetylglucosamine--N-acetylmuramyl-(pentapeptide) pyrophosphoryl-undecaprenol N-acetylglucosamine transferase [Gemmatimonadota bacterium]
MSERTRWTGGCVAVFSGGGTGGHLYPALALADALSARRPDLHTYFVGAERGIEARVLPSQGREHLLLPVEGLRRGEGLAGLRANLRAGLRLLRSLSRLAAAFHTLRPRLVVVTGGYAGGPAGLMASLMGLRLVLQEQNSVPGLTTRALSVFAREVHLAFPEAAERLPRPARRKVRVTGNPVRPPSTVDRSAAARSFGFDLSRPVVLVVGGSQGSSALNEAVLGAVADAVRAADAGAATTMRLLWSTGPTHLATIRAELEALGSPPWVTPVGYIERMSDALSLADVAISRAGAMATSEFLAWGLPAILVPLPTAAADHQRANAAALAQAGAAVLLEESTLEGPELRVVVEGLLAEPVRLASMAAAARQRGRPGAAAEIAASLDALLPPPERVP